MKKLIGIVLLLLTIGLYSTAQTVGHLRYDTVKMYKQGGTAEMVLINKTKDTIGFLFNVGGGRTEFRRVKQLNDSTLIFGIDTFSIRTIGGGGGGTDDAEIPIKIENDSIKLQYNTHYLGVKDNRLVSKVTTFFSYPSMRSIPTNQLDTSFVYIYRSGPVYITYRWNNLDVSTPDDSVTTIVTSAGARLRVMGTEVWASWFRAFPDDGLDDRVATQKAINFLIAPPTKNPMNIRKLRFEPGRFDYSGGLLAYKDDNSDGVPEFFNITIEGATSPYAGSGFGETHLDFTHKDGFGIAFQAGKGVEFSNFYITGTNQLNYSLEQIYNGTSTFVNTTERTNSLSPQAAIVIDPISNTVTGSNRYPGYEAIYAANTGGGGSTLFKIHDIKINGFYVGIILTPNNNTQNNEMHIIDNIWCDNVKYGFVSTNSQERTVVIRNWKSWGSVHTVFETNVFGLNRGEPPMIDGVNLAGGIYQAFNFRGAGGYFPTIKVNNVYAELLYKIGTVEGISVNFFGCHFSLANVAEIPVNVKYPNFVFEGGLATEFTNCIIIYYNAAIKAPMNFKGDHIKFNNCTLSQQVGVPYNTWSKEPTEVDYDNTGFYAQGGRVTNKNNIYFSSNVQFPSDYYLKYNQRVISYSYGLAIANSYATQERRAIGTLYKRTWLPSVTLTVVGDSATATIAALNNKTFLQGQLVWNASSTRGQIMRIRRITGSSVVFDHLIEEVVSGTYGGLAIEALQKYTPPILADISGTSMTNVLKENSITAHTATAGMYYIDDVACYITSAGSGTGTIAENALSGTRVIISTFSYEESGFSVVNPLANGYFADGVLFTKGAIYTNSSVAGEVGVAGWKCTRSGIKGSASPPEFEIIGMPIFKDGLISDGASVGMGGTFTKDIGITSTGANRDFRLFTMDSVEFDGNYFSISNSTVKALEITSLGNVGIGTAGTVGIKLRIDGTDAIRIPGGTTAQRPASPLVGYGRYATDSSGTWEIFNGATWEALATRNFARTFGGGGGADGNGIYGNSGSLSVANTIVTLGVNDITWFINSTGRFKFNGLKSASGPVTVLVLQADSAIAQAEIEVTYLQTVTTSDATPVTAFTIVPPAGSEETITVHVVMNAKRVGVAGAAYAYEERTYEWNGSATLTAFAANTDNDVPEKYTSGLSTCGFTITNSGTNIIIPFTGQVGVNIQATFAITITRTTIPL